MKKNLLWIFAIIVLAGALGFSQLKVYSDNKRIRKSLIREQQSKSEEKYIFQQNPIGKVITDSLDKLKKNKYLVLRLMPNDCHDCIDSIFKNTVELAGVLGSDNVVVIVGKYDLIDYYKFIRLNKFTLTNFFYYPAQVTELDQKGLSYYFLLNKKVGLKAVSAFMTEPIQYPLQTKNYLEWVRYSF